MSKCRLQAILRSIGRLLLLGCLVPPFSAQAQAIFIYVTSPTNSAVVGDNLSVLLGVTSTYEVQTLTVTVSDRVTNLVYGANVGWTGNLSLAGLSRGPQTLTIKATDVFGNSAQTQVSFVHDTLPVLTVLEPAFSGLARPQLRIRATATDDDPAGTVIRVSVNFFRGLILLATGTNNLDTVVDLSKWDGMYTPIEFDAIDSAGQTTTSVTKVYVVSNTNVVEVDRVSGTIRDVSTEAVLFIDGPTLKSKSRSTGIETVLLNRPDLSLNDVHGHPCPIRANLNQCSWSRPVSCVGCGCFPVMVGCVLRDGLQISAWS